MEICLCTPGSLWESGTSWSWVPRWEKVIWVHLLASCFAPLRSPGLGVVGEAQALFRNHHHHHPRPVNSHSASLEVPAADSAGGVSDYAGNMSESVLLS